MYKIISNVKIISIMILVIVVGGSLFYWYELRPAKIRHDCSWFKVVDPAKPAIPAITKEEADASRIKYDECKNKGEGLTGWNQFNYVFKCDGILKQERGAESAKPSTYWYREAEKAEYNYCIHEHGL